MDTYFFVEQEKENVIKTTNAAPSFAEYSWEGAKRMDLIFFFLPDILAIVPCGVISH